MRLFALVIKCKQTSTKQGANFAFRCENACNKFVERLKFAKQGLANVFEGLQRKRKLWCTFLEAKRQGEKYG